jgi:hypothetical protein
MTSTDPNPPWLSGFSLHSELAGQYELDLGKTPSEGAEVPPGETVGKGSQGLKLDGLGPITIFVGANNSGKSRLLRQLFGSSEGVKRLRVGPESEEWRSCVDSLQRHMRRTNEFNPDDRSGLGEVMAAVEGFQADYRDWEAEASDGWIGVKALSLLEVVSASIEQYLLQGERGRSRLTGRRWLDDNQDDDRGRVAALVRQSLIEWLQVYKNIRKGQFFRCMRNYLSLRRCYVPILRGMRPPLASGPSDRQGIEASDCFEERSILDYFIDFPDWRTTRENGDTKNRLHQQKPLHSFSRKPRIFTGLSLYHDIQKRLLAPTHEERKSIREYELFLSVNFFQGREVTLTPALRNQEGNVNDVVHIKIGESEDRPIYDLGDGMQSLIICTYPIITELQQGSLFFLEEPDLCMHPSLQRVFLGVLRDSYKLKGHQFFLTTHSNHLLDLLEDDELVSILSFSEKVSRPQTAGQLSSSSRFRIRPTPYRDRRALVELGVRPSATYLANATIWVEGVSDSAYLRAYMEAFLCYLKLRGGPWGEKLAAQLYQYKEDRHYAFVEYNGSNLPHFSFVDQSSDGADHQDDPSQVPTMSAPNLCAHAIVLADGDIGARPQRYEIFTHQLRERFVVLPGKEIENLIPHKLLEEQIMYDEARSSHGQPGIGTIEAILAKIRYADYAHSREGLGKYLDDKGLIKYGKEKSGTLPSYYKSRWRSNSEGIPLRVRDKIRHYHGDRQNGCEREGDLRLIPEFITQDIVWLCVVLFAHIAQANHDHDTAGCLRDFQNWIMRYSAGAQQVQEIAAFAGSSHVDQPAPDRKFPPEWPLHLQEDPLLDKDNSLQSVPSYRECLLKQFLRDRGVLAV